MSTIDNTLKTLGFIYQAYIALIKCFEMEQGDSVVIEHFGDVTTLSSGNFVQQIEVKHHISITTLADRSEEIWKTLYNWYINFDQHPMLQKRVLFTTAKLPPRSSFHLWSTMDKERKYQLIKKIGEDEKKAEVSFRTYYSKIFNTDHDPDKLKVILESFEIVTQQNTIKNIIKVECKKELMFLKNEEMRISFVSNLVGYLMNYPVNNERWEINYNNFRSIFIEHVDRYGNNNKEPIQGEFSGDKSSEEEIFSHQAKRFVSEINRIDFKQKVIGAINDYCKTNKTIYKYYDNSIVKRTNLNDYKNNLHQDLNYLKDLQRLECTNTDESIIRYSKKFYLEAMTMGLKDIIGLTNMDFFQRGMIQIIVDENKLTWHMGDEE